MNLIKNRIKDLFILELKIFIYGRGYYFKSCNKKTLEALVGKEYNFVQDNESKSSNGVIRGLHYQLDPYSQAKLVRVLANNIKIFIHISIDEVYGSTMEGSFTETDNLNSSSPYSSNKASSGLLAMSYYITYGLPVCITQCTNNFRPYQYPEKRIPFFISRLIEGKKVPIYGTGLNIRDWIMGLGTKIKEIIELDPGTYHITNNGICS